MKAWVLAAAILSTPAGLLAAGGASVAAEPPWHPFGTHTFRYIRGTIVPRSVSQAQRDDAVRAFYGAWKRRYLRHGCGSDRAYVFVNADGPDTGGNRDPNSISVSEGHGYGMMVAALMAGHDPEARRDFESLYRFFKDHPSRRAPYLMAWNQVASCTDAPGGGDESATDGDIDIAYALLLADRQWGSTGPINYRDEAKHVMLAVVRQEIHPATSLILLGNWTSADEPGYYHGTRQSDFMPDHFRAFHAVTAETTWARVTDAGYGLLSAIQDRHSPTTGLIPDFIVDTSTSPRPAAPWYLESDHDGDYSYNACRVPWRLATDYLTSGDPRALAALRRINAWIRRAAGNDPARILDGYDLRGRPVSTGHGMAFIAPFAVAAMVDAANEDWLDALWAEIVRTPREDEEYYGNTLKLLAMIVLSGNWWSP